MRDQGWRDVEDAVPYGVVRNIGRGANPRDVGDAVPYGEGRRRISAESGAISPLTALTRPAALQSAR